MANPLEVNLKETLFTRRPEPNQKKDAYSNKKIEYF
jgi:hypothetical protein